MYYFIYLIFFPLISQQLDHVPYKGILDTFRNDWVEIEFTEKDADVSSRIMTQEFLHGMYFFQSFIAFFLNLRASQWQFLG